MTGTALPNGYATRLQKLLHAEWQGGESYEKFAHRLGIGSGRTIKAWLALDFKIEPDARKLRQLARHLNWQYWELVRYLDTGELPERPTFQKAAPQTPLLPQQVTSQSAKTALRSTFQQLRSLTDAMQQWLELLPNPTPPASPKPKLPPTTPVAPPARESAAPPGDRASVRLPRPSLPEAMTLPKLIASCLERSGMSEKRLAERIDDVGYYTSRETMNPEVFAAMQVGTAVPLSETELDALAEVVDRDRDYFTADEWMRAWIASIHQRDNQAAATSESTDESAGTETQFLG